MARLDFAHVHGPEEVSVPGMFEAPGIVGEEDVGVGCGRPRPCKPVDQFSCSRRQEFDLNAALDWNSSRTGLIRRSARPE